MAEELFFVPAAESVGRLFEVRELAQACASILFGLSHIRHAPLRIGAYVILATLADGFMAGYRSIEA